MAQFDPAAATQAYLAVLTEAQHAKAVAYTQGGHWMLLWGALAAILAAVLVLRSGILVRVRTWVEAGRSRPLRAVLAVVIVDSLLESVLVLPWSGYSDWWREKSYGLSSQGFGAWLGEWALTNVLSLVLLPLLVLGLYVLIRRTQKTWWLWGAFLSAGFLILLMIVRPIVVEPLFNDYTPAPPGPVRDAVVEMAKANGVPSDKIFIYDGSKQSNRYTANVSGLFGTARVAMSDVMFKKDADLAEVKGVVGHEMGHYVHHHVLWFMAVYGLLALAGFFAVDRLFPLVLKWTGAKGVQGIADPAGFPVFGIILTCLALVSTPVRVSMIRIAETDADRFSLAQVNEPDGLARALAKTIEYRAASPGKLEEVLFYDHPAVSRRIRMAMDWKATHPANPPARP
ncbi:MAG: peptidase M48 [Alphaproteobacteria bacterium PA2]|nr:MAG: peptidase M48 [Alphaproteobacteria bacterium PA2]